MLRFYLHNTLGVKFHKFWYCGTLVASVSPAIPVILILVDIGLKVVLHVILTPLSLEFNCFVSDDVTVVDVLV